MPVTQPTPTMYAPAPQPAARPKYKRRKKLIDPKLQLSVTAQLAIAAAVGLLFQFGLFVLTINELAAKAPVGGTRLFETAYPELVEGLLITVMVFMPLMVVLGIRVTFRVAGPIYRFTRYLEAVEKGEQIDECRIRTDDQLHDLCAIINRVTEEQRVRAARQSELDATRPAA